MYHDSSVTGHPPFFFSPDFPAIVVPTLFENCGSRIGYFDDFDDEDLSTSADGDSSGKVSVGRIGK
jgi:hypothetical protein